MDLVLVQTLEFMVKEILEKREPSFWSLVSMRANRKRWENYKKKGLIVLGIPSNSFGQEKENEKQVSDFCQVNFNITFPLTSIYDVKGDYAHEIYKWAEKNHGKSSIPKWNFHKILIDKNGKVADTFASFTNPKSKKILLP